jgi:hypothetical protein
MADYARRQPQRRFQNRNYPTDVKNYTGDYDYGNWNEQFTPTWGHYEWWATPGPFTGMGPRGYVRSDEDILQDVCDRLTANGRLDASNIEVNVHDHVVDLKGSVDSRQDKRLAEDIAESVFGVDDVNNRLNANRQGQLASSQQGRFTSAQQGQMGTGRGMFSMEHNLFEGEQVIGPQGKTLGTVKEIHTHDFAESACRARRARSLFGNSRHKGQTKCS